MSTFKHTPGPWRVSAGIVDNPRLIVENDLGLPVCAMSLRGVHGDTKIMEANARLIAAAPGLLEALRPFAELDLRPDCFDKRDDSQPIYARDNSVITVGDVRRAVAAIAKATQEPQA